VTRVGIVGVGAMGMGIAKALLSKGFPVVVRDIVPEREAEAIAAGARRGATPAEVASRVDVLITVVVDAAQTRAVLLEGGLKVAVVMMCSTIAPRDSEDIAAKRRGAIPRSTAAAPWWRRSARSAFASAPGRAMARA